VGGHVDKETAVAMRNALLGLLTVVLLSGSACAPRAMTYTGIAIMSVGGVSMISGLAALVVCSEGSENCPPGENGVNSTVAAVWAGASILAAVVGFVLWVSGPDVGSSDDSSSSDVGLTGEAEAGLDPLPSSTRPGAAPLGR
jgi:hypothetical protein